MNSGVYVLRLLAFFCLVLCSSCNLQSPEDSGLFLNIKTNNAGPMNLEVILGIHGAEFVVQKVGAVQQSLDCNLKETLESPKTKTGAASPGTSVTTPGVINETPVPKFADYELKIGYGFYKLHLEEKSWHDANETCSSEGAHLAIINSKGERDMMMEMLKGVPKPKDLRNDEVYLGINDLNEEGKWETIFGEPIETGFADWAEGEPNNYDDKENCGVLQVKSKKLNDKECELKFRFICEKSLF